MYTHKHTCTHTYIYSRPLANRGIDLSITFSWSSSPTPATVAVLFVLKYSHV